MMWMVWIMWMMMMIMMMFNLENALKTTNTCVGVGVVLKLSKKALMCRRYSSQNSGWRTCSE
jgi:hypothetical protein